jgi:hypothetical protein
MGYGCHQLHHKHLATQWVPEIGLWSSTNGDLLECWCYLSNILFLSVQTSQTMSTCFPIVEAPTLKRSAICVALWPMSKSVNDNSHNFLISNWIHALRFQEGCQFLHKIVESLITHSIVQEELSIPHMGGCTPNMCFHIASICGLFGFNTPQTRRVLFLSCNHKNGKKLPANEGLFSWHKKLVQKTPPPLIWRMHNSPI